MRLCPRGKAMLVSAERSRRTKSNDRGKGMGSSAAQALAKHVEHCRECGRDLPEEWPPR